MTEKQKKIWAQATSREERWESDCPVQNLATVLSEEVLRWMDKKRKECGDDLSVVCLSNSMPVIWNKKGKCYPLPGPDFPLRKPKPDEFPFGTPSPSPFGGQNSPESVEEEKLSEISSGSDRDLEDLELEFEFVELKERRDELKKKLARSRKRKEALELKIQIKKLKM